MGSSASSEKKLYFKKGSYMCIIICTVVRTSMVMSPSYRIAGKFRGVLIFVIFVVELVVTKFSTHEN